MSHPQHAATMDVRRLAPSHRHTSVLAAFRALAPDEAIEIVNDHDPKPLYHQFQAEAPDGFAWDYLENGPAVWRVNVRMLARAGSTGRCCGGCGGGS